MKSRIWAIAVILGLASGSWALSESEINNDRANANGPFTFPDTLTGSFTNDGSLTLSDYFSFTAVSGLTYEFSVTSSGFPAPDPGIAIWPAAGGFLVDHDANSNTGEFLQWVAPSSGTFYVEIYEATGTPGGNSYSVSASEISDVNDWFLY